MSYFSKVKKFWKLNNFFPIQKVWKVNTLIHYLLVTLEDFWIAHSCTQTTLWSILKENSTKFCVEMVKNCTTEMPFYDFYQVRAIIIFCLKNHEIEHSYQSGMAKLVVGHSRMSLVVQMKRSILTFICLFSSNYAELWSNMNKWSYEWFECFNIVILYILSYYVSFCTVCIAYCFFPFYMLFLYY